MTARRLMRVETKDGVLFVPAPAYRCWRCDSLMPIEREREPLCEACEAATAQMANPKPAQGTVLRLASNADQDGLMQEVDALVAQGLGYAAICREFNAAGRTTAKGAQFRSSDLARAHQRWKTRSTP